MSIGNAINSLPIAYAPLNGTGRKVAYALANPTVEAVITSRGTFTVDALGTLQASTSSLPVALRVAPDSLSVSVSTGMEAVCKLLSGGLTSLNGTATLAGTPRNSKAAGSAAMSAAALMSMAAMRLRIAECDFRSPYVEPSSRTGGNAVNTFALGMSTVNSTTGTVLRSFITIFSPTGNAVFDPDASLEPEMSISGTRGNVIFGSPAVIKPMTTAMEPTPNVLFGPTILLAVNADTAPFAMNYRKSGVTFVQDVSTLTVLGSLVAGGRLSGGGESGMSPSGGALRDALCAAAIDGVLNPLGAYIAGSSGAFDTSEADLSLTAKRMRVAYVDQMDLEATLQGKPWDKLYIVESIVYDSDDWSSGEEIRVIGSIVCQVAPESIVCQVAPESTVYGQEER